MEVIFMKAKCIENKYGNANFTLGEICEVKDNRIICNFIFLLNGK